MQHQVIGSNPMLGDLFFLHNVFSLSDAKATRLVTRITSKTESRALQYLHFVTQTITQGF